MNLHRILRLGMIVLPIGAGFLPGCDKGDSVQRYEIAKTGDALPPPVDTPVPMANEMPVPGTAVAPIHWTVPAGWKEWPGDAMRYARFGVSQDHPELELTVVRAGGSLLGNVNRWEGQIGLPPTAEEDLNKVVTHIDVAGAPVDLFDRTGPETADHKPGKQILAAIVHQDDGMWFVKLEGPADLVGSHKADFDAFVQSIRFDAPAAAAAPVAGSVALPITFTAPPGWQQETAGQTSMFRVVAFTVGSGPNAGEAVVTHVAKNSGSMLDNINRWRGQVELPPVADASADPSEKITIAGGEATLWNFDNPTAGHSMILAMTTHGSQWWFFKLAGPSAMVGQQKSNFNNFVNSIQFQGDAGD